MKTEPLFQDNILQTIVRNFTNSFNYGYWFYSFLAIIAFIYIFYCLLTKIGKQKVLYPNLFNQDIYNFDKQNKLDWLTLAFPALGFVILAMCIYSLDDTLFNNYDLMSISTTNAFSRGMLPSIVFMNRFQPTAFWDMNIIYAITHNYNLINIYLIAQAVIISYLLYIFLTSIPVKRRIILIGCCIICPTFFWLSNAIFCEMFILIYILGSLLAIKKFSVSGKAKYLWFYILLMNMAIYAKETVILFYFGILACSILYNVFIEKINLNSFIHPFRTMKQLPLETLMFLSMALFALAFLVTTASIEENNYLDIRNSQIIDMLLLYKFEIVLTLMASFIALFKIFRGKINNNPMFEEGIILGSLVIVLLIILKFKLVPILWHVELKTYYMILPAIFSMIYIVKNIKSRVFISLFFTGIIIYSTIANYKIYQNEQGIYYHDVAKFMGSDFDKKEKNKIFLTTNSEKIVWAASTWSSSYKHYFPDYKIVFKYPDFQVENFLFLFTSGYLHMYNVLSKADKPEAGDYYVVKKTPKIAEDMELIKGMKYEKVHENKIFEIYKIK